MGLARRNIHEKALSGFPVVLALTVVAAIPSAWPVLVLPATVFLLALLPTRCDYVTVREVRVLVGAAMISGVLVLMKLPGIDARSSAFLATSHFLAALAILFIPRHYERQLLQSGVAS